MAKIPEEFVEKVREKTNITDVVGKYVQLKKSGKNYFGLCPFHEERTPSFSVNEEKQIFHCFSCGRGGNVFTFLMDLQGLSFPQAVEEVAKDDGIEIPTDATWNKESPKQASVKPLIDVQEKAAKLYHHILVNTKLGESALEYLHQRKISDEMIETFNLGFAPEERILKPFFAENKTDYQLLRKSGLFTENTSGDLRDWFVGRLMFPIRNTSGATIGFSGRLLQKNDDLPKYLNSPETEIFNKRRIVYNFDLARPNIRKDHDLILFEGFMDVISAYQAGVKNGVASMGTSLTNEQIYDFNRVTDHVYVCYDGDTPGQKATNRAVDLLSKEGHFNVGVIQMPNGIDPDEYRRGQGSEAFQKVIINGREPIIKFKINYLRSQYNLSNEEDKLEYVDQVLHLIASLDNPVEQDLYLNEIATTLDLSIESLKTQVNRFQKSFSKQNVREKIQKSNHNTYPQVLNKNTQKYSQVESAERQLLSAMLLDSDVWTRVNNISGFNFIHDDYQQLYMFAQEFFKHHDDYHSSEFSDFVGERKLQSILAEIEIDDDFSQHNNKGIDDCVKIIMEDAPLNEQIKQIKADFDNAKQLGDEMQQLKLASEIIELQRKLQQLKSSEN
ncbi:DNA primase [Fructilactobacillus lindneri]|uniref:DNA primase n=2 Tax=Fructilactobacillus lindneri TaxID=53444 RepID=A0A0R2JP81_9LACO|nr:DNA primase [Fructilactobacillus lindneri]ANZ58140.1 DNA primase [Fructilactobacillus lindneri]ANZ59461.1 DNA primase [Fructilactobacillus lindneri]KRN78960.1 DNA primase [Fructilactobacillus lindneri DSM 20690 = JCM 11027]POG98755.1 DNA primase [Fructilactobacillus lindneri]POH03028.1 DNA primase [Fructilactobacillus lindneri]